MERADQGAALAEPILSGRAAVRECLLDPLAGLPRKRGVAASDHARDLAKLADALSYMTPANLRGLCELVLRHSSGKAGPCWPDVALVRTWAMALQQPPPRQSDYAQSLIRSAMGRQARDEGWLVELFQIAKRIGPPPGRYLLHKLRDEAGANTRRRLLVRERIERGAASPEDQAWIAQWWADLTECEAIQSAQMDEAEDATTDEGAEQ
jgi:hypothetical protein